VDPAIVQERAFNVLLTVFGLTATALWIWILVINGSSGYKNKLFFHSEQISSFREIIRSEKSPEKRLKYQCILYGFFLCLVSAAVSVFLFSMT
jgi:hypothetical protein